MLLEARESLKRRDRPLGLQLAEEALEWVKRVEVEDQELGCRWHHLLIMVLEVGVKKKDLKNRPVFILLEWCEYLKILIKNVLSRGETVPHNHKSGLLIYSLEPSYVNGSPWVATLCQRQSDQLF